MYEGTVEAVGILLSLRARPQKNAKRLITSTQLPASPAALPSIALWGDQFGWLYLSLKRSPRLTIRLSYFWAWQY